MNKGILFACLAALLFGASTPAAKWFLSSINPGLVAGLLYLGAGIGLACLLMGRKIFLHKSMGEWLHGKDWLWLGLAVVFGGIAGPLFLMFGLQQLSAANTALLLNLETVFTALCAWFLFREHFAARIVVGMLAIVVGGVILAWTGTFHVKLWGFWLVTAACFCWALDNNFTRFISAADAMQVAMLKTLLAGILTLSFILPSQTINVLSYKNIFLIALIGLLGYGLSLQYFVLALRYIGTARTSAYFSIAPFLGAVIAILVFHEPISWQFCAAGLLMAVGVWLHVSEEHDHEHEHLEMAHEHLHVHDEHHQHSHSENDPPGEPHTHWHVHPAMRHKHPHYPDIHHQHKH